MPPRTLRPCLSLPIFLIAVRVQYNYCIVLRVLILTIKPTYFLLSLSIFSGHATPMAFGACYERLESSALLIV